MWTVTKGKGTGHSPTQLQVLWLLSDITGIAVRGNYFKEAESTWIDGVRLVAGDEDADKLRSRVQKSAPPKLQANTKEGVGVGLVLAAHVEKGVEQRSFRVIRLQPGSPAFWSSIRIGDIILEVDEKKITEHMSLRQLGQLLRGEVSSTVRLTLLSVVRNTTYEQVLERVALDTEPSHTVEPVSHSPDMRSEDQKPDAAKDADPKMEAIAAEVSAAIIENEQTEDERRRKRLEELKRLNLEKEIQILERKKARIKRIEAERFLGTTHLDVVNKPDKSDPDFQPIPSDARLPSGESGIKTTNSNITLQSNQARLKQVCTRCECAGQCSLENMTSADTRAGYIEERGIEVAESSPGIPVQEGGGGQGAPDGK